VVAEARFHERARRSVQRLARRTEHVVHDRRHGGRPRAGAGAALQAHRLLLALLALALRARGATAGAFALQDLEAPSGRRTGSPRFQGYASCGTHNTFLHGLTRVAGLTCSTIMRWTAPDSTNTVRALRRRGGLARALMGSIPASQVPAAQLLALDSWADL